ncbi:hypothetical protein B0H11DRAFT_1973248, partial [Mycena galericulata]
SWPRPAQPLFFHRALFSRFVVTVLAQPLIFFLERFSVVLSLPCWNRRPAQTSTATFSFPQAFFCFSERRRLPFPCCGLFVVTTHLLYSLNVHADKRRVSVRGTRADRRSGESSEPPGILDVL